jgi:hypothetical protein
MANITRTVIYPVPTEFYGDNQDTSRSGIATYVGPARITFWYENLGTDAEPDWEYQHSFDSEFPEDRDPPAGTRIVELNAETHTLHAIALWGGIAGPDLIETPAGPDSEPNPIIPDYLHFNEVFDLCSFNYDFENDRWPAQGVFSGEHTETDVVHGDGEQRTHGWHWVRQVRDQMLAQSDDKIPADAPEGFASEWREYRQKLRDLPATWNNVGNNTYLIVWPREPGDSARFSGVSPETGLSSTDVTTDES